MGTGTGSITVCKHCGEGIKKLQIGDFALWVHTTNDLSICPITVATPKEDNG